MFHLLFHTIPQQQNKRQSQQSISFDEDGKQQLKNMVWKGTEKTETNN